MSLPAYLRTKAEHCLRLSRACFDLTVAEQLRAMADDLRGKAAELEGAYPPMSARNGARHPSHR